VKSERPHCHSRAKNLLKLCHVVVFGSMLHWHYSVHDASTR